jgi:hypothetical protein
MMEALDNDELVHEAPAIIGCEKPRRSRTAPGGELWGGVVVLGTRYPRGV